MDSSGRVAPTPTPVLSPRISTIARFAESRRSKRRPAAAKRRARPMPRQNAAISSNTPSASNESSKAALSAVLSFDRVVMVGGVVLQHA